MEFAKFNLLIKTKYIELIDAMLDKYKQIFSDSNIIKNYKQTTIKASVQKDDKEKIFD